MLRHLVGGVVLLSSLGACSGGVSGQPPEGAYDCSMNTPGSGDLANDLIGQWRFIENASGQFYTFGANNEVIRTYISDVDDDVSYVKYRYTIGVSSVMIGDDPPQTFEFSVDEAGIWTVSRNGADQDWTRCELISPTDALG